MGVILFMKKRVLSLILFVLGIIFTIPFLAGLTGFVVGVNNTTRVLGLLGLGFIIVAAIIENIEEKKFNKKKIKYKSH